MRRVLAIASCLALTGCCWWSDEPLPEPATDYGLSGAESKLDHLTDKRDSRVAAAVDTAERISTEKPVKDELAIARAMLPAPSPDDLAYAQARADKADDAFYAEQLKVARDLAVALVKANADYEREKARKQAEYESRLKEKEMALAAEQEARQSDKWTYAGIALVTLGLLAAFLTPLKLRGAGVSLAGVGVGAFPLLSKQSWFLPGILGLAAVSIVTLIALSRRSTAPSQDATPPPQG